MARPEKTAVVEEIRTKLTNADAAVLTEYRGLTVSELAELRAALRPAGTEYKVFKNTLARRAVEAADLGDMTPMLEGPVAIAFVAGDAVDAAKALREFGRANPALVVKGGLLGGRVIDAAEVAALADVEPREVLLARLAGGFQAPMTRAAGLFQAFTRNLAYGVKALIDQRVAAGEDAPPVTAEASVDEAPPVTAEAPAEEAEASAAADEAPAEETPAAEAPADEAPAAEGPADDAPAGGDAEPAAD